MTFRESLSLVAQESHKSITTVAWILLGVHTLHSRISKGEPEVTERQLCKALIRDLNLNWSGRVEDGLQHLGLFSSEDVGAVVKGLIAHDVIQQGAIIIDGTFSGIFSMGSIDTYLESEGIKRQRFGWRRYVSAASWVFYITGMILVVGSYTPFVSGQLGLLGWCVGMCGYGCGYVKVPLRLRF